LAPFVWIQLIGPDKCTVSVMFFFPLLSSRLTEPMEPKFFLFFFTSLALACSYTSNPTKGTVIWWYDLLLRRNPRIPVFSGSKERPSYTKQIISWNKNITSILGNDLHGVVRCVKCPRLQRNHAKLNHRRWKRNLVEKQINKVVRERTCMVSR
jgi:hypothetical protein